MNSTRFLSLLPLAAVVFLALGCQSSTDTAKERKYIILPPEVGSHIPRRVPVDEAGAAGNSGAQSVGAEALRDMQRRGDVNSRRGN